MKTGTLQEELEKYQGRWVDLRLGLDKPMSYEDLREFGDYLANEGVEVNRVESTDYPFENTLRVVFYQPEGYGFAFLPIIAIIGGLGGLGIMGFLGWKVSSWTDKLMENLVPISLIASGVILGIVYVSRG